MTPLLTDADHSTAAAGKPGPTELPAPRDLDEGPRDRPRWPAAIAAVEFQVGAVIALMLASGRALEDFGVRRARRSLSLLADRIPSTALVQRADQALATASMTRPRWPRRTLVWRRGAFLQEGIDVMVIANALRATTGSFCSKTSLPIDSK